jgi:hypothetical protein
MCVPCHHGKARPRVVCVGETAFGYGRYCEYTE